MENFTYDRCTKVIFGRDTEKQVGEEVKKTGNTALLLYGSGSIKRSGLYDRVLTSLKNAGIKVVELGGVKPNPTYDIIYKGIDMCRKNSVDFVLAVGAGSTIDSAKGIAVGVPYEGDVIDITLKKTVPKTALPVGVVLTMPAAGSETSQYAVATYEENGYPMKRDIVWENNQVIRPLFAIMNPELTFTVPPDQTAYGICDIMAHVLERYFTSVKNVELTDRLCEGVLKTVINNGPVVMEKPDNYDARAEIMWAGSIAHNDLLSTGRQGDFVSHMIEHELSALYDIAHGAGLAILFPAWMKYVYKFNMDKFLQYATRVWNVEHDFYNPELTVLEGIKRTEDFFRQIGLPVRLSELDIPDDRFEEMAEKSVKPGSIKKIDAKDIVEILKLAK